MSRRPATVTQADVARVLRAAKQVGAFSVEVKVGEAMVTVQLDKPPPGPATKIPVRL